MKELKIQSIGDLITNSSTEVFTIIDNNTIDSIKDLVKVLCGEDYVEHFDYYLDYCEVIESRAGDIAEMIESYGHEIPGDIDHESSYKEQEDFAYQIIKSVIPEEIWRQHYQSGPKYLNQIENSKELEYKEWLKENIADFCNSINENHEWQCYPSLIILPKDPSNNKDKDIAKKLEHIPFFCNHSASYC